MSTIHSNDCGNCRRWHIWPEEKQEYGIPLGDCDKIERGRKFYDLDEKGNVVQTYTYDGYSFEDECYDEEFGCFEEASAR